MKHNEHEVPMLKEFAISLGVDVLTIRKFFAIPNPKNKESLLEMDFIPSQSKYQIPRLLPENHMPVRTAKNPCKNLWNCPSIHWDGTVCSCFLDFNEENPLGNLRTQSFKEIWFDQSYKDLRKAFRRGWKELPLCKECGYGYQGGDIGRESNVEAIFF